MREIKVYSANWCGNCRQTKQILDSLGVEYTNVDIEQHQELVDELNINELPVVISWVNGKEDARWTSDSKDSISDWIKFINF